MYVSTVRRVKALINLIVFGLIFFGVAFAVSQFITKENETKEKVMDEFRDAMKVVKVERENKPKVIPLNSNIISTCVSGKKVIIVNGIIYYHGTIDSWGDIQGVNCENK